MKKNDNRPSWDEYFIDVANIVASRSTCLRRKVGAVVVKDKRILATGYNGVPSGIKHCLSRGCLREKMRIPSGERHELCRGLHAEQNAILQAVIHHIDIQGSSIYITNQPCIICSKMLINAQIKEIVIASSYPDALAREMLKEAGVKIRLLKLKKKTSKKSKTKK
ncbi:cytidine/deoxycytidylate deaminase family protein [Candidatus Omnitrophota bacterium]